jgi:preprotein translocase subunit SecG
MAFLIFVLTAILVMVCLGLVLLVLIQLPKKEAGAGVAFGGAATDALFGAGSGNVLTKVTKYLAGTFFVLSITLSLLQSHYYHRSDSEFRRQLQVQQNQPLAPAPSPEAAPAVEAVRTALATNLPLKMPEAQAPSNAAPAK